MNGENNENNKCDMRANVTVNIYNIRQLVKYVWWSLLYLGHALFEPDPFRTRPQ
jgi:hypothetical protein